MLPPLPYAAHVLGMNCIGPWAPAVLLPWIRPIRVSTKWMAARYGPRDAEVAARPRRSSRGGRRPVSASGSSSRAAVACGGVIPPRPADAATLACTTGGDVRGNRRRGLSGSSRRGCRAGGTRAAAPSRASGAISGRGRRRAARSRPAPASSRPRRRSVGACSWSGLVTPRSPPDLVVGGAVVAGADVGATVARRRSYVRRRRRRAVAGHRTRPASSTRGRAPRTTSSTAL